MVLDRDDALVYISLGARLTPLTVFACRHGAGLAVERRRTDARRQLLEYLHGRRTRFELPVRLLGTDFQRSAWNALLRIPYGETRTYADQAEVLGNPAASRAVGRANATNPVPIVVPCHRVIGHKGALTGFGGGLSAKRWLLDLECPQPLLPSFMEFPLTPSSPARAARGRVVSPRS